MDFTKCYMVEIATNQEISLNKNGNKYYIVLSNGAENVFKHFETLEEAEEKYLKIASYFIHNYYNFEDRKKELLGDD